MQWIESEGANLDAAGRWSPGIGDPSVMGWVTVGVYLLAAVQCARKSRNSDSLREGNKFWASLAVVLFLLALNKQLDLQSLFTQIGRDVALQQGWYAQRRWVQGGFIAALGLAAATLAWWLRRSLGEASQRLAAIGLTLLMAFVVMRAASFHHMDILINTAVAGIRMNWVLENASLVVILWATCRTVQQTSVASAPHLRKARGEITRVPRRP